MDRRPRGNPGLGPPVDADGIGGPEAHPPPKPRDPSRGRPPQHQRLMRYRAVETIYLCSHGTKLVSGPGGRVDLSAPSRPLPTAGHRMPLADRAPSSRALCSMFDPPACRDPGHLDLAPLSLRGRSDTPTRTRSKVPRLTPTPAWRSEPTPHQQTRIFSVRMMSIYVSTWSS